MTKRDLYGGRDPAQIPTYSYREVAHITGVPVATVRSWVRGRYYPVESGSRFFEPILEVPDHSQPLLSFVNLVEVHVLAAIRRQHRIQLPRVRRAIEFSSRRFRTQHPLADEQFATDGVDLFV